MEKNMETTIKGYMGGCENYGPFLGTLNIRCRIIIGIQIGAIKLTATHISRYRKCTGLGLRVYRLYVTML